MTIITIEAIKEKQDELAILIAKLEEQVPLLITIHESKIELRNGEHYAGVILGRDGQISHHLILLPDDVEWINFPDAKEWAENIGGELPSRQEQSLLYANLKEQFRGKLNWSGEQCRTSGCAWLQAFDGGAQLYNSTSGKFMARAIRRVAIN